MASSSTLQTHSIWQSIRFLVLWNLANTLPWIAAGMVYRYLLPITPLAWVCACLFVGFAQWLVLQRYIAGIQQWAVATFLGGIIGFMGFAASILATVVVPLLTGIAVGIAQWLVLRHKLTAAFWWIVATTVGAIVGMALGYLGPSLFSFSASNAIENTVFVVGVGIQVGSSLVTGVTMLWLLRRNANRKSVLEQ